MSDYLSFPRCAICHSRPANKTNSHLIPSFFIAMVSSIDNSYKRDKELLFTIGQHSTKIYVGRSVKEEDLKDKFDFIDDERLSEMSKMTAAKDYIFCPHCEKKLGEYLESPWHDHLYKGKNIAPESAYFFWTSLLWRVSMFEGISFKLPTHIEKSLGKRLNYFIQAKDEKKETVPFLNKAPFMYKVLYCKDFSKEHSGFIYLEYDQKSKIASIMLGDVAACFSFHKHGSFEKHSFYGLETTFSNVPINDGHSDEIITPVDSNVFESFGSNIIDKIKTKRLAADRKNILGMWKIAIEKFGVNLPPQPTEEFIRYVISQLYSESTKTGEKTTRGYFAKCFGHGLEKFYGIQIIYD